MSEPKPFDGPPNPNPPHQDLSPQELRREKLRDPSYLPTHEDKSIAFPPEDISDDTTSSEWYRFCFDKENPVFEFLNEEFVNALSNYLSKRVESMGATENEPITILEVAAGNGRLTHFLQQGLEKRIPGKTKLIATDSGQLGIKTDFPVEQLDYEIAIKKYQPKIIICSWMPLLEDFSASFRSAESVDEYILIGESDDLLCGDEWLTWGQTAHIIDEEERKRLEAGPKPYETDGFERVDITEVSQYQIARPTHYDNSHNSRTVSFRRKK